MLASGRRAAMASIAQVNISSGGVPKRTVAEARIEARGLVGDHQDDRVHHGSADQAVSLYALERIEALARAGHPIAPGSTGENITIRGLNWDSVVPGARLRLGAEVVVEVTGYATPCRSIQGSFSDRKFGRLSHKLNPGWSRAYARVLSEGAVRPGDLIVLEAPSPAPGGRR
jgi:MOSC domain-containing protein YiiM